MTHVLTEDGREMLDAMMKVALEKPTVTERIASLHGLIEKNERWGRLTRGYASTYTREAAHYNAIADDHDEIARLCRAKAAELADEGDATATAEAAE